MTTFSAGCDGQVRMWNPSQGPNSVQIIGKHDQPVRSALYHLNIRYVFIFLSLKSCNFSVAVDSVQSEKYIVCS
jgi:hypothetical protein